MPNYIVTVTSRDRVGIVAGVTRVVTDQGGNVLELSQTVLRGFFTIILEVEFPDARDPGDLRERIAAANARYELNVTVLPSQPNDLAPVVPDGERFILTVLGEDHPGTIHQIAEILAAQGVNIVDLSSRVEKTRFSMVMEAFLPPTVSPEVLRSEIVEFGKELGLDAYVQHENIFLATAEPRPVRIRPANAGAEGGVAVDRL